MYSRLLNYLTVNKILSDKQYGFDEGHSTDMALLHMINDITEGLDNKLFCIGIFIDLSKAFDTVDHKLLIRKLNYYGIRGIALQWFIDYLTNRKQYISINKINSKLAPITCGVSQGSILVSMLFLIFINDIVNTSKITEFILYADDNNLFFKDSNLNNLILKNKKELKNISKWFKLNQLSLNIKKQIILCSELKIN